MDYKSLKTLEYHKIIEKLSSYAGSEAARKMCADLKPMTDINSINDALHRQAMHSPEYMQKAVYHFRELLILLTALSVLRSEAR